MAKFRSGDLLLKDGQYIKFGTSQDANVWWDATTSGGSLPGGDLRVDTTISGVDPLQSYHLTTRQYVDDEVATLSGSIVLDHGNLTGLGDDDHTQYILADGTRAFTGIYDAVGMNLTEGSINFQTSLANNGDVSGNTISGTVTGGSSTSQVLYMQNDGNWAPAKADSDTTMPAAAISTTASGLQTVLTYGAVKNTAWSWTTGGLLYVSDATAGDLTQTAPTTSGSQVQVVGVAIDTDTIFFNPLYDLVEIGEAPYYTKAEVDTISGTLQSDIDANSSALSSHTSDSTIHFTESSIDHGSISGLGDDDHPVYVPRDGSRGFTSTVSGTDPVQDYHLATKWYIDNEISTISGGIVQDHGNLTGLGDDDHSQYILVDGTRSFTGTVGGITPTADNHLTTKYYVDSLVQGLDWQDSVIDIVPVSSGIAAEGNRYIASTTSGTWTEDYIYEYISGTWSGTAPNEGMATWIENEDYLAVYNGTDWVRFGSTVTHNYLNGLQGGTAGEYYHLTQSEYDTLVSGTSVDDASGLHHHDSRYYTESEVDGLISAIPTYDEFTDLIDTPNSYTANRILFMSGAAVIVDADITYDPTTDTFATTNINASQEVLNVVNGNTYTHGFSTTQAASRVDSYNSSTTYEVLGYHATASGGGTNWGGYFEGSYGQYGSGGVKGAGSNDTYTYGVYGATGELGTLDASYNYAVYGSAVNQTAGTTAAELYGVYGYADVVAGAADVAYGVYGHANNATTNWAGYFASGNVMIENNLTVSGTFGLASGTTVNEIVTTISGVVTDDQLATAKAIKDYVDEGSTDLHGRASISNGASTLTVNFADLGHTNYTVNATMENTTDSPPSIYAFIVSGRTSSSFTVTFMGDMDSANYVLNWTIIED